MGERAEVEVASRGVASGGAVSSGVASSGVALGGAASRGAVSGDGVAEGLGGDASAESRSVRSGRLCPTPPGAAGLVVDAVSVTYPGPARSSAATTAVDQVCLEVAPGEVVALLGPSGCGKSSLLRAVAGLEPVAGGRVLWDGADMAGVPVHRRGFGLMFQDGQLFAHKDVGGNVEYGLRMHGVPKAARSARVAELLDVVGLPGSERRSVATMSGGERQRVALARALAPQPQLLLLDEPLSALDRALRERLATDLRAALVATGTTALFVTHDHDEAFTVADRVAVMSHGRLLQVDAPERLWSAPATREVAEFLGYQAFLPRPMPPLADTADTAVTPPASTGRSLAGRAVAPTTALSADDRPSGLTAAPLRTSRSTGDAGGGGAGWVAVGAEGFVVAEPDRAELWGAVVSSAFRRGGGELTVDVEIAGGVQRCAVRVPAGRHGTGTGGSGMGVEVGQVIGIGIDWSRTARLPE